MKKDKLPILSETEKKTAEEKIKKFSQSKILGMILDNKFSYLPPYFYNNPYALRCELGVGESNKEYIKNAYKRAGEIYDILFSEPPEVFFFDHYVYDCSAWEEIFIKPLLKSEEKELKFIFDCYKKYEHIVVFDVPKDEEEELARENRIVCFLGNEKNKPLKKWIDMQFSWTLQRISLVSCKNDFIFTIYDERGCDIVFATKEKMREYFPKLRKYLLEYDIEEMEKRVIEKMIMTAYELYDIYAVILYIRAYTGDAKNAEIAKAVKGLLDEPRGDGGSLNEVRRAVSSVEGIDREHYEWAFTENVYTYMPPIVKEEFAYRVLSAGFAEIISAIESGDGERIYCAADAMHNVPIIFSQYDIKEAKKHIKREISYYRKKYNKYFLSELI